MTLSVYIICPMSVEDHGMTIEDLADLVGVPVRTIRYYISENLLPSPGTRGKGTVYGEEHLLRLRLIRILVEQRIPLVEIREKLATLTLPEIQAVLSEEQRRAQEQALLAESPRAYVSALLSRARSGYRPRSTVRQEPLTSPSPELKDRPDQIRGPLPKEPMAEEWHRWELAPGIELNVRADALDRYRGLIEKVMRVAGSFRAGAKE